MILFSFSSSSISVVNASPIPETLPETTPINLVAILENELPKVHNLPDKHIPIIKAAINAKDTISTKPFAYNLPLTYLNTNATIANIKNIKAIATNTEIVFVSELYINVLVNNLYKLFRFNASIIVSISMFFSIITNFNIQPANLAQYENII